MPRPRIAALVAGIAARALVAAAASVVDELDTGVRVIGARLRRKKRKP